MPGSFFDTNVIIYIAPAGPVKAAKAEKTIAGGDAISLQVLNKFTNTARRKMQMPCTDIHAFLSALRGLLTVHPLTVEIHDTGMALAERYGLSISGAMIAASALNAGCGTLWPEDMRNGMALKEGLRIVNPFLI
jgi:predicted nucleic acid-binding protein